jgi:hypothetical protein
VNWDYVVPGHLHIYSEVRDEPTPVRYCGATASSWRGDAGVVLVDSVPGFGARPLWRGLDISTSAWRDLQSASRVPPALVMPTRQVASECDVSLTSLPANTSRAVRKPRNSCSQHPNHRGYPTSDRSDQSITGKTLGVANSIEPLY